MTFLRSLLHLQVGPVRWLLHCLVGLLAGTLCTLTAAADPGRIVPADELATDFRAFVVKPKPGADGYSTPETSSYASLDSVQFGLDDTTLTSAAQRQLDEVARTILKVDGEDKQASRWLVEGHTCDRGTFAHNEALSVGRAQAARDYLIKQGVPAEKIETRGLGETRPVVPNSSEPNRQRNRRVDFVRRYENRSLDIISRDLSVSTTAATDYIDARFEAIAESRGGLILRDNEIDLLRAGDKFRVELTVLEGCHVYALLHSSASGITWLMPPEPVAYGKWCYVNEKLESPPREGNEKLYHVLDNETGRERVAVIALPSPVADIKALEDLLNSGVKLTAEKIQEVTKNPNAELHLLSFDHQ